jgi:hypothetical protein
MSINFYFPLAMIDERKREENVACPSFRQRFIHENCPFHFLANERLLKNKNPYPMEVGDRVNQGGI